MTDPLLIERRGAVEVWTLNNPERRNPVTGTEFIATFAEHMARVNDSGDVGAVVLTGAGSAFSTGGDVKAMARREGMFDADVAALRGSYRKNVQSIPRLMSLNEVPFVAAVNGPAVGAGCDLAFMCDLRIASEKAFFAESFVKLGLIPGDGGAWFLPRGLPAARAAEMILTGDRVSATQALEWGMLNDVVAPEALLERAVELADRVAANSIPAVRMAKRLMRESARSDLGSVLELSAAMQVIAHQTDEHNRAMQAVLEPRKAGV